MDTKELQLTPYDQRCTLCNPTPAPYIPVAVLRDGHSFEIPTPLCAYCLHRATRDQIITPEIRADAVAKLYQLYGLCSQINPDTWALRYTEQDAYRVSDVDEST